MNSRQHMELGVLGVSYFCAFEVPKLRPVGFTISLAVEKKCIYRCTFQDDSVMCHEQKACSSSHQFLFRGPHKRISNSTAFFLKCKSLKIVSPGWLGDDLCPHPVISYHPVPQLTCLRPQKQFAPIVAYIFKLR